MSTFSKSVYKFVALISLSLVLFPCKNLKEVYIWCNLQVCCFPSAVAMLPTDIINYINFRNVVQDDDEIRY